MATASAQGVPNSTYLSVIWYVDEERIALSNQFLSKTMSNLEENPRLVLRVIDPDTMVEYELEGSYLRSETSGTTFDGVRTELEAVAAQSGMEDVFHLRSVVIIRVDRCAPAGASAVISAASAGIGELLAALEVFVRRLGECRELAEATHVALRSVEDLFGFRQSMLLLADAAEEQLFVVGSNGYPASGIGSEVSVGEGLVGVSARRRQQVSVANLDRLRLAGASNDAGHEADGRIPVPGLPDAQSLLATPLIVQDRLIGVLYLDSTSPGYFSSDAGRLLEILSGHLAATIAMLESGGVDPLDAWSVLPAPSESEPSASAASVAFHEHDGSVLVDGDYVIRGVPGRILFSLLDEYQRSGRTEFANREIRLDHSIGLPAGNDNLEARLLTLRRRLAEREAPFRLDRVGRGRLHLTVTGQLDLVRHDARPT